MRTPKLIVIAALPLLLVTACKKSEVPIFPLSSVTIVHAMPTGSPIVPKFGDGRAEYYSTRRQIGYGSSLMFSTPIDSNALIIVPITDSGFTIFQGKLPLVGGGIYSLFLAGDTTKPDTMLVKDNIPNIEDSSIGVRFVNLALDGKAISINLVGNDPTSQAEISNLGHQQISNFKKYLADATIPGEYDFEIRDQASGILLYTFSLYYTVMRSNTVVIAGSTDPSSPYALNVFSVNNF